MTIRSMHSNDRKQGTGRCAIPHSTENILRIRTNACHGMCRHVYLAVIVLENLSEGAACLQTCSPNSKPCDPFHLTQPTIQPTKRSFPPHTDRPPPPSTLEPFWPSPQTALNQ